MTKQTTPTCDARNCGKFKVNVSDLVPIEKQDDQELCKWLRARNFNIVESEKMIRKSMDWRRKNRMDTILQEWKPPEVLVKYLARGRMGFDKEGFPITYNLVSYMDFKGLHHAAKRSDIMRYCVCLSEETLEICKSQTEKLGKKIDQTTIILDAEKLGMKHLTKIGVDTFNSILRVSQDNYPEIMRKCIIINAPMIFPFAFSLVKAFLTGEQRQKIIVMGSDWKKQILHYIDADQLPVHWGGTLTGPDGDPYCQPQICLGGDIPKSWYLTGQDLGHPDEYITKVTVPAKGNHKQVYDVTQAGSIIKWEFKTESYDILFGVFFTKHGDQQDVTDMEALHDITKANSHVVPQDGFILCHDTGTYVLFFDNSFSWFNSKSLAYFSQLVPPADMASEEITEL